MAEYPFPLDAKLTATVIAYRNPAYIADLVLPRQPVDGALFSWFKYPLSTFYTVPQTRVGRKGSLNRVEMRGEKAEASVEPFGLEASILIEDIKKNPAKDHVGEHAELLAELMLLDREVEVAGLMFNPDSYSASNVVPLAAGSRFTDAAAPVDEILLDLVERSALHPNTMTFGHKAWTKARRHPKLVQAVLGTTTGAGVINRQQLAEFLEIDNVYVGRNNINRKMPGQPEQLEAVWGDCVSAAYINPQSARTGGITWGYTATWGDKVAGQWDEKSPGLLGSRIVRTGEYRKELLVAPDCGALLTEVL